MSCILFTVLKTGKFELSYIFQLGSLGFGNYASFLFPDILSTEQIVNVSDWGY